MKELNQESLDILHGMRRTNHEHSFTINSHRILAMLLILLSIIIALKHWRESRYVVVPYGNGPGWVLDTRNDVIILVSGETRKVKR